MNNNSESSVGIVASAGSPKVLCSCTQDMAALLSACANVKIGGQADLSRALMVAALALKHRRNKNGSQRIVAFVGSPLVEDEAMLVKLAKNLKKNNIAVDVVSMGESDHNDARLRAFVDAVDKNGNSHLVTIPPGLLPSDVLLSSPVVVRDEDVTGAGGAAPSGAGAFAEYGGVDPALDPELAMALRASMEEERARMGEQAPAAAPGAPAPAAAAAGAPNDAMQEDDSLLAEALRMSMAAEAPQPSSSAAAPAPPVAQAEAASGSGGHDDEDDEEALRLALEMSQAQDTAPATAAPRAAAAPAPAADSAFADPAFVQQLLDGLPGVDINDPAIQDILASLQQPPPDNSSLPNAKKQKEDE